MGLKKITQVGVQKNEKGEVVAIFDLKTLTDEQVATLKEQALVNQAKENEKYATLSKKVEDLEYALGLVQAELRYNRGDITREEYEELCGLSN